MLLIASPRPADLQQPRETNAVRAFASEGETPADVSNDVTTTNGTRASGGHQPRFANAREISLDARAMHEPARRARGRRAREECGARASCGRSATSRGPRAVVLQDKQRDPENVDADAGHPEEQIHPADQREQREAER